MKNFVDTNVFLRLVEKENEQFYKECYNFFKEVEERNVKILTSPLVLAEIVWVLKSSYSRSKEYILKVLKTVRENGQLKISDDFNPSRAIEIFSEEDVKFVDTLIASFEGAKEGEVKIVSYDEDFDNIEVDRVEPGEVF
ncbi:MAG: PIN domain-containing protein [Candidatus Magasanikbacteria bacterium]